MPHLRRAPGFHGSYVHHRPTGARGGGEAPGGEGTDKPDCQIAYVLSTQDRPKPKPSVGVGAGGGSGGVRGGIGVSLPIGGHKKQVGTFTLDIVDVAQNAQIWSGAVDVGIQEQQISDEEADEAVRVILEKFPDRAAK